MGLEEKLEKEQQGGEKRGEKRRLSVGKRIVENWESAKVLKDIELIVEAAEFRNMVKISITVCVRRLSY